MALADRPSQALLAAVSHLELRLVLLSFLVGYLQLVLGCEDFPAHFRRDSLLVALRRQVTSLLLGEVVSALPGIRVRLL